MEHNIAIFHLISNYHRTTNPWIICILNGMTSQTTFYCFILDIFIDETEYNLEQVIYHKYFL